MGELSKCFIRVFLLANLAKTLFHTQFPMIIALDCCLSIFLKIVKKIAIFLVSGKFLKKTNEQAFQDLKG